jgi:hypothetical protein
VRVSREGGRHVRVARRAGRLAPGREGRSSGRSGVRGLEPGLEVLLRNPRDRHPRIVVSGRAACQLRGGVGSGPPAVHVGLAGVNDPALRSAAARHATKEHRAAVARHAVVMTGDVTTDPAPHNAPLFKRLDTGLLASVMPLQRSVALYEKVCRSVCSRRGAGPAESAHAFEVVPRLTVLKSARFSA